MEWNGINVHDDVEEHGEGVDVVGLAPRREHVLGQMVDVPLLHAVRVDVDLEVMPVALNGFRVRACCRVNETDPVVHGLMRVTLAAEIIVSRPSIAMIVVPGSTQARMMAVKVAWLLF